MEINHLVGELLLHHNCVVIPNLGGFVAKSSAALIDYKKGKVYPPKKQLTFNKGLINNDGLLVTAFAEKTGQNYDVALSQVLNYSSISNQKLKQGERIEFQNVGFLFQDKNGKISFEQDRLFNLLLNAYGLGSVTFIPETKEEQISNNVGVNDEKQLISSIEEKTPVLNLTPDFQTNSSKNSFKKVMKYVAAAAILPIAFYSFWIPMTTDVLQSGVIYTTDFNPFKAKEHSKYIAANENNSFVIEQTPQQTSLDEVIESLPEEVEILSYKLHEDLYIPVRIKDQTEVKSVEPTSSTNNISGYHLIAGCFSELDNAKSLVNKLTMQGFSPFIVDKNNGLHRVSIQHISSRSAAIQTKKMLADKGISTWVLKK